MNNTATNSTPCPTVRKQIGKTTYIVRVHFSQTAKETMEDKIKRMLREEVRKIPCSPALAAVLGNAAPYLVLDNEHQKQHCLFIPDGVQLHFIVLH